MNRDRQSNAWVLAQSILMLLLLAAGPSFPAGWHFDYGWWVGALFFFGAGALGLTGVRHLGGNRTASPHPKPGGRLVQGGVYAYCRHPLYLSLWLAGMGWVCLWQNVPTLTLALVQIPFFDAKARFEERLLRKMYPEYAAYALRVKRFIPGIF